MTGRAAPRRTGPARESQRASGQFWTPDWVAEAMVRYVTADGGRTIFDPAVGAGAFLLAAKRLLGAGARLGGCELDASILTTEARRGGLTAADLAAVEIRDFVLGPPAGGLAAVVANPPYIRHHRLGAEAKAALRHFSAGLLGRPLDGRSGHHFYFLLRALSLLAEGGRLSFILPADVFEGLSAPRLWRWITGRFRLDAVITFDHDATPFPGVDTNAVIVMLRRAAPGEALTWARCEPAGCAALAAWVESGFSAPPAGIRAVRRALDEAVETGLSRPPAPAANGEGSMLLGHAAAVMRGIATGCNEFFFLTTARAGELEIPPEFLIPAVGRTRDVAGEELTADSLARLDRAGRPTWLLTPDGRPVADFPPAVRRYLERGVRLGLPLRPLIAQRTPWYRMERRRVPPVLFAYLGRRNVRFIRNRAGVVPLTCLLCVYPRLQTPEFEAALWEALRDAETLAGLASVGKSYGGGAIKVEPRALERLPLPPRRAGTLRHAGLAAAAQAELPWFRGLRAKGFWI